MESEPVPQEVQGFQQKIAVLRKEIGKIIVGNDAVVDGALACLLARSHALLEGVPGLGKTLLVKTIADVLGLEFSRIQFTPDLMPADIIGTVVMDEGPTGHVLEFRRGPVFANVLLADEINRATPKTQSALLEAMQEHRVTVGRKTHLLEEPYFVLATQNPLEMEGTYPLPEAQLDRFFYKLHMPFPTREQLHTIVDRTTQDSTAAVAPVVSRDEVLKMQALVRRVPVARPIQDYAIRLLEATHPQGKEAPELVRRYVRTGASPRGAQALLLGAKISALCDGRFAAAVDDVQHTVLPALRHRVLLSFEGEAEDISTDEILTQILHSLPIVGK